jgi:hypothetical protein
MVPKFKVATACFSCSPSNLNLSKGSYLVVKATKLLFQITLQGTNIELFVLIIVYLILIRTAVAPLGGRTYKFRIQIQLPTDKTSVNIHRSAHCALHGSRVYRRRRKEDNWGTKDFILY